MRIEAGIEKGDRHSPTGETLVGPYAQRCRQNMETPPVKDGWIGSKTIETATKESQTGQAQPTIWRPAGRTDTDQPYQLTVSKVAVSQQLISRASAEWTISEWHESESTTSIWTCETTSAERLRSISTTKGWGRCSLGSILKMWANWESAGMGIKQCRRSSSPEGLLLRRAYSQGNRIISQDLHERVLKRPNGALEPSAFPHMKHRWHSRNDPNQLTF